MNMKNGMILLMAVLLVFMAAGMAYQHRETWLHGLETADHLSTAAARAERAERADRESGPIEIGVIGPWSVQSVPVTNLLRGIELAAGLIPLFVDRDVVAPRGGPDGGFQPGRSGAHDRDLFGGGDDWHDQVREIGVGRKFDHLRIDHEKADVIWRA